MSSTIKILDCTLRDGGYYNNWNFPEQLYQKYIQILTKQEGVNCIEIGFRFLNTNNYYGPFAFTRDHFITNQKFPKFNYAIMINASDLIKAKDLSLKKFALNNNSKIKIVRVAAHFFDISKIVKYLTAIKNLGYKVFLNIMQINFVSDTDLINTIKKLNNTNIDVLYFADSLGNLVTEDVKRICFIASKYWKGEFGFHAHDNLGMALKNSKTACRYGATWIDGTMQGMGRGAGNVKTESLLKTIMKLNSKKTKKIEIISNEFKKLKINYKWGKSKLYNYAAKKNIHPTYVQKINDKQLPEKKCLKLLRNISHYKNAKNFSFDHLNKILIKTNLKTSFSGKSLSNCFKDKNILLLANGPSLKAYSSEINYFAKLKNSIIFSLNFNNYVNDSLINYFLVSHFENYIFFENMIKTSNKKIIIPTNIFKNEQENFFSKKNFIDYGIMIRPDKFIVRKNHCILPNNLVFSYALAVSQIGKAKQIFLAGFDGYDQNTDKLFEMEKTVSLFKKNFPQKIISITPTKYNFYKKSIYSIEQF